MFLGLPRMFLIRQPWDVKVDGASIKSELLQLNFPNPAVTSIYLEVLGLPRIFLIRRPWDVKVDGASIKSEPFVTSRLRRPPFFTKKIFSVRHLIQSGTFHDPFKRLRMNFLAAGGLSSRLYQLELWLEPSCCKKRQKKSQARYWFEEKGTSEDSVYYLLNWS